MARVGLEKPQPYTYFFRSLEMPIEYIIRRVVNIGFRTGKGFIIDSFNESWTDVHPSPMSFRPKQKYRTGKSRAPSVPPLK